MEKIKKILTDPKLAQIWKDLYDEMRCEVPRRYNVTRILKELGLGKKLMTEYGETFYIMCVISYVGDNEEGQQYEWVNKETLEMKECNEGEIYSAKQSILYNLNRLIDYRVISENAAEDIKVALNIEDEED